MLIGFVVSVKVMLDIMDPAGGQKMPEFEVTEEDVEVGRGLGCGGCELLAAPLGHDLRRFCGWIQSLIEFWLQALRIFF